MRISGAAIKLAAAIWAVTGGCADEASEPFVLPSERAHDDAEGLAQRIPIDFPGSSPSPGGPPGAGATPPAAPPPSTPPNPGRTPVTPPRSPTPPTTTPAPPPPSVATTSTGPVTVRDPNGLYFANVVAGGTGCPAGSWSVQISSDGKAFTLTFSRYELTLTHTDTSDRRSMNCTINIAVNSPAGLSFAVTSLAYSGAAFLEAGVKATHTAYYSFTGQRIQNVDGSRQRRVKQEFAGPYDDTFVFEDEVTTTDQVFSECGRQRNLNVITTLQMINTAPKRSGYVNLAAIDGRTTGAIILKIATRPCRP